MTNDLSNVTQPVKENYITASSSNILNEASLFGFLFHSFLSET